MANQIDAFKATLKAYLDNRAASDELFAKTYAKEGKTLDECAKYVISEVRKTGRSGFTDDEVYNFAVHYYDEDDLGEINAPDCKVVVNHEIQLTEEEKAEARAKAIAQYEADCYADLKKREEAEKPKPAPKKAPEKKEAAPAPQSPSLFDFDELG